MGEDPSGLLCRLHHLMHVRTSPSRAGSWRAPALTRFIGHNADPASPGGDPLAKLNKLDPLAWLTDVLERIVSGQTKRNELHTLLPWNWKPACVPATISSA